MYKKLSKIFRVKKSKILSEGNNSDELKYFGKNEKNENTRYYKLKNGSQINVWEYAVKEGNLPLEELIEISKEEYLLDRSDKTICFGTSVINEVKTKFGFGK